MHLHVTLLHTRRATTRLLFMILAFKARFLVIILASETRPLVLGFALKNVDQGIGDMPAHPVVPGRREMDPVVPVLPSLSIRQRVVRDGAFQVERETKAVRRCRRVMVRAHSLPGLVVSHNGRVHTVTLLVQRRALDKDLGDGQAEDLAATSERYAPCRLQGREDVIRPTTASQIASH